MLGTLVYLVLSYAVNIALILTTYIGLLGIAALPITAILDLLGRREAPIRPTDEVNDFYTRLSAGGGRATQHATRPAPARQHTQ